LFGGTTTVDAATLSQPTAWADVIQVRWQQTDLDVLSIMSSTLSASATSALTTSQTGSTSTLSASPTSALTTSQTGSTAVTAKNTNHLSTGAEAGIGVGAAVAIITIALLAGLLVLRRRRQNNLVETLTEGRENLRPEYKHELSAQYRGAPQAELDNGIYRAELGGSGEPAERCAG